MAKRVLFQSTLERHPKHVHAIGMIAIEMGNLDPMLGELLGALLHVDRDMGRIIYQTPRAAMGRIDLLGNVAERAIKDPRVTGVIKRAKSVTQKRHEMIHDIWGLDETTSAPRDASNPSGPLRLFR